MTRIATLGRTVAAALFAGALLGAPAQAQQQGQQQGQTGAGATPTQKPQTTTGACRVKDYVGGRTCTGDVPEGVCAAIAREAKGQYTWTNDECP